MKVKDLNLSPSTNLVQDYINQKQEIEAFFDYMPYKQESYSLRYRELMSRSFARQELVERLKVFNKTFTYSEKSLEQLDKLLDPQSVAIVGGQQPGLFTGPLYTIYKAITVIQLAKEQEKDLQVPVVPIFWIAGEDHDLDEVNHVYIPVEEKTKKVVQNEDPLNRVSLSNVCFGEDELSHWFDMLGQLLPETKYTGDLLEKLRDLVSAGDSYVHFFGEMLSWLFKDDGLVLLDANDPSIRELEKDMFAQIIEENEAVHFAFVKQQEELVNAGYDAAVETTDLHANLFLLVENERVRLERDKNDTAMFRADDLQISKKQLLEISKEEPYKLSNNVVTRPVMQDFVLPVLAFVGGPGEIAYWATLKKVFAHFQFKMPPVIPRLSITIIDRQTEKLMKALQLTDEDLFNGTLNEQKKAWLKKHSELNLDEQFFETIEEIKAIHKRLEPLAEQISATAVKLREKNSFIIEEQLQWLLRRFQKEEQSKYRHDLHKYDKIMNIIRPLDRPQERIFNVLYYLNEYGDDLISRIIELGLAVDEQHKLVFV